MNTVAPASGAGDPGAQLAADRRLEALIASGLLDSDPETAFDRYTRLARRTLGVPVALVSLVTDRRQFFKSQEGLGGWAASERQTPLSHSFCRHVVDRSEPLYVADAREDPTLCENPAIEALGVIAYAGHPIRNSEGLVFGALCAIDGYPRRWSESERSLLTDLADGVSAEIQLRERILRERRREASLHTAVTRLEAVRQELSEKLRAQEETAAMVSHDLRTPLSALLFTLGMLERARGQGERERLARRMRSAIEDMDALVGDLLDVAKLTSGGIRFQPEPTTDTAILEQLRGLHEAEALGQDVALELTGAVGGLNVDRRRVVQALSNLISNALRATPPGGRVRVRAQREAPRLVAFHVGDTGPGIEEEELKALFQPFAQGRHAGALGLGLAIAQGIAAGHDGQLTAVSEPGTGTVFTLRLPS